MQMQNDALAYFSRRGRPIVAACSALGGPVAVIRISGESLDFLQTLIGKFPAPNSFKYTSVHSVDPTKRELDKVLVLYFKAPHSFTGEDVVEIQGHGVPALVEEIIQNIVLAGAERALPGEFSFRAFLNSKMSLEDAEALQTALSTEGLSGSWASTLLGGTERNSPLLNQRLSECLESLQSARGRIEAAIDFPEAETEQAVDLEAAQNKISNALSKIHSLLSSYYHFCRSAGEPRVVIIGAPNVGKSSLLNSLMGSSRALVSPTAGTTRDVVEIRLRGPRGLWFRLFDTAGIHQFSTESVHDELERAGIELGLQALKMSQVVVVLRSLLDPESAFDVEKISEYLPSDAKYIDLYSFSDKTSKKLIKSYNISNLSPQNTTEIMSFIEDKILELKNAPLDPKNDLVISRRQGQLIEKALEDVERAQRCVLGEMPIEIAGDFLRSAEGHINNCIGQNLGDEYIGQIFSQFCLGK